MEPLDFVMKLSEAGAVPMLTLMLFWTARQLIASRDAHLKDLREAVDYYRQERRLAERLTILESRFLASSPTPVADRVVGDGG